MFIVLMFALVAIGCARANTQGDLQTHYDAMDEAIEAEDAAAFMKHVGPNFALTTSLGQSMTRDQLETMLKDGFKAGETKTDTLVETVTTNGATATVVARSRQTGTFVDPKGVKHQIQVDNRSEDTWTKMNGDWTLTASKELTREALVDGKKPSPATKQN
jgi:ketosteroid isomerase-like protein